MVDTGVPSSGSHTCTSSSQTISHGTDALSPAITACSVPQPFQMCSTTLNFILWARETILDFKQRSDFKRLNGEGNGPETGDRKTDESQFLSLVLLLHYCADLVLLPLSFPVFKMGVTNPLSRDHYSNSVRKQHTRRGLPCLARLRCSIMTS